VVEAAAVVEVEVAAAGFDTILKLNSPGALARVY